MHYKDDSLALHTDLYQINMAKAYWDDGVHNRTAVFDLYFRKKPFGNGYAVFAGLEKVIEYVQRLRFSETDLAYLKEELGYEEEFIDYLKTIKFTGNIRSLREGEIVFENVPLLRVEANLAEADRKSTRLN